MPTTQIAIIALIFALFTVCVSIACARKGKWKDAAQFLLAATGETFLAIVLLITY